MDLYDLNVVAAAAADGTQSNESSSSSSSSLSSSNTVTNAPAASLNEEVTQVFSQLGRFWGGVRKQSKTVLESARKDLGDAVSQAQKELGKTFNPSTSTSTSVTTLTSSEATLSDRPTEKIATTAEDEQVVPVEATTGNPQSESNANETPPSPSPSSPSATSPSTATTFFSRLQSSLPPNITPSSLSSTFQRHLPLENLQQLQHSFNLERATADLAQLRTTLVDNIQRVQSETTIQQAEKLAEQYLQKGESFFKEAGEFLKDAVKVLPPEGDDASSGGVVWDGTDIWPVPSTTTTTAVTPTTAATTPPRSSRKGKEKQDTTPSAPRLLGKRKEILLRKLHSNPDEIRKNPEEETDVNVKEMWSSFTKEVQDDGTIQGKIWQDKVEAVTRSNDEDILALLNSHKQLVPSELSDETFWTRYFFRIAQIQREEERRKALLEGTNKQDDDQDDEFTWEDEEEEGDGEEGEEGRKEQGDINLTRDSIVEGAATLAGDVTSSVPTPVPSPFSKPASSTQTPSISPRRSEDSYDVVSSNVSSTGQKSPETKRKEAGKDGGGDEDDSDWE